MEDYYLKAVRVRDDQEKRPFRDFFQAFEKDNLEIRKLVNRGNELEAKMSVAQIEMR